MNYLFREEIILLHAKNIQNNNRSWTGREVHRWAPSLQRTWGERPRLIDYPKRMIVDISSKCKDDGRKQKKARTKGFCTYVEEAQRELNEWQYCLSVALGIKASIPENFYQIIAFSHWVVLDYELCQAPLSHLTLTTTPCRGDMACSLRGKRTDSGARLSDSHLLAVWPRT